MLENGASKEVGLSAAKLLASFFTVDVNQSNFSRKMGAAIFCPSCYGGLRSHCLDLLDDRLNLNDIF